jgi:hypothetical protein
MNLRMRFVAEPSKSRRRFFLLPSIVLAVDARLFAGIGKFGGSVGVDSGGLHHSGPGVPFILVPFDQMQNLASLLGGEDGTGPAKLNLPGADESA